jgi:aminopeptidase
MRDPRYDKLANVLIHHSTRIKPGEHLLIEMFDAPEQMSIALVEACRAAGGHPHVTVRQNRVIRALVKDAGEDNIKAWAEYDLARMKRMDAYIGLRGSDNISELSGIPDDKMKQYLKHYQQPVHFEQRVNHTKWCVLRWPSPSMAQLAQMNTEDFEQFYFDVCTLDYGRMDAAAEALKQRMEATDKVHIVGPGDTDLTFSIKGIPAIPCCGQMNIPDGECFTAPVRDSVNGVMHYNTPTIYNGISFENVRLEFKNGKIVNATADQGAEHLDSIFNTDEGSRYVGEFAIGFNPYIKEAMKDILFDEKICGSLHFTPGRAYEEAFNGNKSEIHWDMVLIQREDHGGGELFFDDQLVRKNGMFTTDDLMPLNPEQLVNA